MCPFLDRFSSWERQRTQEQRVYFTLSLSCRTEPVGCVIHSQQLLESRYQFSSWLCSGRLCCGGFDKLSI